MGSTTVKLLLRATAPPSSQLFSLRKSAFPIAAVTNERFYGAKSRLEPLDVLRFAETARISLTPQQVEEFTPKIRQVVDWLGQLQAVDLQSVEPAIRADAMTAAVPTNEDSYIKVLKVLNKE